MIVLQEAQFMRRLSRLYVQYSDLSESRKAHEPGNTAWYSFTRQMDRLMSDIMEIENGDAPNILVQLEGRYTAKRLNRDAVIVEFRHRDCNYHFTFTGDFDLRNVHDRNELKRRAVQKLREAGVYWA